MAEVHDAPGERIVAVFPDEVTAERAAERARRLGAREVAVGNPDDEARALVGEMREETSESWAGPSVALYTPEMARHIPGLTVIFAAAGAVLALPLAFVDFGGVSWIGRLFIAAVSGAVGGGTIGFLVGGFLGARRRAVLDLAEERGVVVGIEGGNRKATAALVKAGAMRVDRLVGQMPIDTVASHESRTPSQTVRDQPVPQDEP
ncbi:MAG: hypothetical protein AB1679_23985 [Actinomycetota bacterium]|jgi:hypothetical protein